MSAETILASWMEMQKANINKNWRRDSPKEATKVDAYWEKGDVYPTGLRSPAGKSWAMLATAYYEEYFEMPAIPGGN